MTNDKMMAQISGRDGFIAALDQSGGSTPGALRLYGIPDNAYSGDAEMFRLVHEMRVRIMTAPAFTGAKVIATILFEGTMDGEVRGKSTPAFLWEERGVIPAADAGGEARCVRHQDALGHQPGLERRYRCNRGATIRGGRTDRRAWADADHRAGSLDQEPGQSRCGSHPSRGIDEAT